MTVDQILCNALHARFEKEETKAGPDFLG